MNYQFHTVSFEIGTKQELRVPGTVIENIGTRNWKQVLGTFKGNENTSNMPILPSNRYPTGAPSTMTTDHTSLKVRS